MTHPPIDAWQPLSVPEASALFARLGVPFWIAGGWAIDLFLGSQTREHADIDVAMLRGDTLALRALAGEFQLYVANAGKLTPWDGALLRDEEHQFWAHRRAADAWSFEVLLERHDSDRWRYRRNPAISRPLSEIGGLAFGGVPYIAPEIALLYKSLHPELDRSTADFAAAAPALNPASRRWLRTAIETANGNEHAWLPQLRE